MEVVSQAIRLVYESSCRLKVPKDKQDAAWWSRELQEQRAESRRAFNRANFTKNKQYWKAHADLSISISTAFYRHRKKLGWEDYCEEIESSPEAARHNRLLAGKPGGLLKAVGLPNEEYAELEMKGLKLLLETLYPGFREEEEETRPSNKNRRATKTS